MPNINCNPPERGAIVHLIYVAKDGKMSERLVFIIRADSIHWHTIDMVKQERRCFLQKGLLLAEKIDTAEQQQTILDRLTKAFNGSEFN